MNAILLPNYLTVNLSREMSTDLQLDSMFSMFKLFRVNFFIPALPFTKTAALTT